MAFEKDVMVEATRLRKLFADRDQSYLEFSVQINGPIDHDSLRIDFTVGSYGESVTADSVDAALDEYFRRKGWKARHEALRLTHLDSHYQE